jgi:hypothetical protein
VLQEAGPGDAHRDLTELREQILDLGTRGETVEPPLLAAPLRRALFDTGRVAGFGWSCFSGGRRRRAGGAVTASDAVPRQRAPRRRDRRATGTYAIRAEGTGAGLGRLVDDGDGGDTYNYSPPATDRVVDHPTRCA